MDKKAEFMGAMDRLANLLNFARERVAKGDWTVEKAAIKLRTLSIEVGAVACMPFRDGIEGSQSQR